MKRLFFILMVLAASVPSVVPLLSPGYFPMHDDTQVARVIEMGKSLTEGQFPVRMVRDLGYGYGYPIFNFYGPLPYYVGGALYALGVPALTATKLMMGLGVTLPAVALFVVVTHFLGWQAGLVSSLLYLYSPYHAAQIYVRGAVGEYWTLIFWPLILYGFLRSSVVIGSLGVAGAILSHTLMGYVTILFAIVGVAVSWIGKRKIPVQHVLMVLLGLGLSAFFWLPALAEMGYTSVSGQVSATAHYADHFVCPGQLWSSLWGFGGSAPGCIDGMSFMVGKAQILLAALGVALWILRSPKKGVALLTVGATLGLVGVFMTLPYSEFLWRVVPGFPYLQYPWRFLSVAGFGFSLLGGVILLGIKKNVYQFIAAIIVSTFILVMNMKWFVPQYTYSASSKTFEDPKDLRFRVSKISDEYLPSALPRPKEESATAFDTIEGRKIEETATIARYVVESTAASEIVVRKAYFPGWRYWINNQEVIPRIEGGLPVFALEPGQSVIELAFTDTPIRTIGNMVSLVSLLMLGWKLYDNQRKAKR